MSRPALANSLVTAGMICLAGLSFAQPAGVPDASPPVSKAPTTENSALLLKARELGAAKDWKTLKAVARELVTANPEDVESNAWLGLGAGNSGSCREAIAPLTRAFNGRATVEGVAKTLAKCLGTRPSTRVLAGKAWLAAAREDKDGDEALKAASLLAGNPKAVQSLFDAYAYADERGKLPETSLAEFAAAAEATKKLKEAKTIYQRALTKTPDARVLVLSLARINVKLKDAPGAGELADRLLQANPNDLDALAVRADAYLLSGDAAAEERILREALSRQPHDPILKKRLAAALGRQACALAQANDSQTARNKAGEALRLDPDSVPAKDALAQVYWGEGNRTRAGQMLGNMADRAEVELTGEGLRIAAELAMDANDLKRAKLLIDRASKSGSTRTGTSAARLTYLRGEPAAAEKKIAAYLAVAPQDPEALRTGGDIAYDSGRIRTARERYEKADASGGLPPAGQGRLCEARVRDSDYEGARKACGKALSGGQDDAAVHANLGLALARLGDKDGARREIAIAVAKGANNKSTHLVRGLLAESDGLDGEALDHYDKVLAIDPANVEANAQSGKLLLKRARYQEAAARLAKAWRANPQDFTLAVSLAKAQFGTGALSDAQRTIRGIPEGGIDDATRLGLSGQVQHALGNYKKANELFAKALEKSPNNAELLALQGENYLNLPHYEKAIQLLEAAQKADPSRLDVSERLARLYAETGDTKKAAEQIAQIESKERVLHEQQRRAMDVKNLRRVSVGKDFVTVGKIDDPTFARLGRVLRDAVAADIGLSPYIEVIDHTDENDTVVRKARDGLRAAPNARLATQAGEHFARYTLSGSYQIVGGSLQMTCSITDINTRQSYRGGAVGDKDRWAETEKRAVLEMLSAFVPLSPQERSSLERAALERANRGNLESLVHMQEAEEARRQGDKRLALHYLEEAHAADLGNARAVVELAQLRKEVAQMNRVAVLDVRRLGDVDDALVLGLRYTLSSKLSGVRGIQVIDNDLVDNVIRAERDYVIENKDTIDPATLPQAAAAQIAANILLQPFMEGHGDGITVGAVLVQISDGRVLLGDQLTGTRSNLLDLQNDLALDIVRKLYGEPTEAEMAMLRKKQSLEQYQHDMAELARLRAEKSAGTPTVATKPAETSASAPSTSHQFEDPYVHRVITPQDWANRKRIAGTVLGGIGVASIGAGFAFYLQARYLSDKISDSSTYNHTDYANGRFAETKQWIFYSVGVGCLGAGLLLRYVGTRELRSATTVTPFVTSDAAGFSAQGAF